MTVLTIITEIYVMMDCLTVVMIAINGKRKQEKVPNSYRMNSIVKKPRVSQNHRFKSSPFASFSIHNHSVLTKIAVSNIENDYSNISRSSPWFLILSLLCFFSFFSFFNSSSSIIWIDNLLFTIDNESLFISAKLPTSSSRSNWSSVSLYPFGRLLSISSAVGSPFTGAWGTILASTPYFWRWRAISYTANFPGY